MEEAPRVSRRLRILVVEDDPDSAETMTEILALDGHTLRVVADGGEALRAVAEFAPEVVLLDIGLPVLDGYDVTRRLREASGDRRTWIVAATGYGLPVDRERALAAGCDRFLVKPVPIEALHAVLAEAAASRERPLDLPPEPE